MKHLLIILLMFVLPLSILAQSTSSKATLERSVSKYDLKIDKNTKELREEKSKKSYQENSFNFHYNKYLTSDENNRDYTSLMSAHNLNPGNSELFFELAKYFELKKDKIKKKEFCQKLKATKLSPALREYAYNTLMSVEENGILISYGEDDTYPIWVLQTLENIRTDVTVLNYNLLMNSEYRTRISKEKKLRFSKSYSNNISILKDVARKNSKSNIYYSLTVSHLVLTELKGKLFSTGLALKYSKSKIDNSLILKNNWENKFLKTHITNVSNRLTDKKMNLNYTLPLYQLKKYYKENKMVSQENYLNSLLLQIGKNGGKQKEIEALLKK